MFCLFVVVGYDQSSQNGVVSILVYLNTQLMWEDLPSAVYMENRKGAKTVPWGTTVLVSRTSDLMMLQCLTYCERLVR